MCLITSSPPDDEVVPKKVIYADAPRRSTSIYDPHAPRRSYPSHISPRSSVTRTVYTEPREKIKERSYARGSYGDLDRDRGREWEKERERERRELERCQREQRELERVERVYVEPVDMRGSRGSVVRSGGSVVSKSRSRSRSGRSYGGSRSSVVVVEESRGGRTYY